MANYRKGKIVEGTVTGIEPYGIFVSLEEYYTGLVHISEISHSFVKNVNDFVKLGDMIKVEILDVDEDQGQLKLSIKNIDYKIKKQIKKKKIIETNSGFKTLSYKLPIWINEYFEKNLTNSIDK